jgi:hypothetical protein
MKNKPVHCGNEIHAMVNRLINKKPYYKNYISLWKNVNDMINNI